MSTKGSVLPLFFSYSSLYTVSMRELKLIEGGVLPKEKCERRFLTSCITNTRLMGAMGMHVHWEILGSQETEDLHQFFYFDTEEYGLESYRAVWSDDFTEIDAIIHSMMDCLGGTEIMLTQRETAALLCEFAQFNQSHGLAMPTPYSEYQSMIRDAVPQTQEDRNRLMDKICEPVESIYQLIHYFMMRCFGRDFQAARWLTRGEIDIDLYPELPPLTLCRNTIDEGPGEGVFLCESLIESNGHYQIMVSEITVEHLRITACRRRSGFPVSPQEAALQLARPEFVTVYELLDSDKGIENDHLEMEFHAMISTYENGRLFLSYYDHNRHVNKRIYRLGEDLSGIYYLTDSGQFLAASYTLPGIRHMERQLSASSMGSYLLPVAKYEFKEPILYDFIESDYTDFEAFLHDLDTE